MVVTSSVGYRPSARKNPPVIAPYDADGNILVNDSLINVAVPLLNTSEPL